MEEPMDVSEGSDIENAKLSNAIASPDSIEPNTLNENKCDSIDEEIQDSEINDNESHDLQDPLKINKSDIDERETNTNFDKEILNSTDTIIIQSDSESEINEISNKRKDKDNHSEHPKNHTLETNENTSESLSLRRSSRAVSKIIYDEDSESEEEAYVEEVIRTPSKEHQTKFTPTNIKHATVYANIGHKYADSQNLLQKNKESSFPILDSNHNNSLKNSIVTPPRKMKTPKVSANIYSKMASQGTTITLVNGKNTTTPVQPEPQVPQQPILLPSLTDDMFVVEAPSFIVPYVYEKPSIKHFRKFVDNLGKEVEEELKKNVKKEDIEKHEERDDKDNESVNNGVENEREVEKCDESQLTLLSSKKSKRRHRNQGNDDDKSWDGESLSGSDSDGEKKVEIIKTKDVTTNDIKKLTTDINCNKTIVAKRDSYFTCSLGQFFMNIGMNLVQEYVQKCLLDQQKRRLRKEHKLGKRTNATKEIIESLTQKLEFSQKKNEIFKFSLNGCKMCNFKTESKIVLSNHLERPHFQNNSYVCNECQFQNRSPYEILCHMDMVHQAPARLEPPPAYNECPNCPYEDNRKNKFAKHLLACNKKFKPELNLIPPLDWEPPAKIPKIVQMPKPYLGYQKVSTYSQLQMTKTYNQNPYLLHTNSVNKTIQTVVPLQSAALMQNNLMLQNPVSNVAKRINQPIVNNIQSKTSMLPKVQSAPNPPSISIIPLPRQSVPSLPVQAPPVKPKETYVTCEICDGFIQNLEMLRSHLQWIHQIKVHPKLMQNRPPLNCQKCQFRFFTDQGLERHLLGSHGLVTTSMQEASDAGKDSGRCPICGRVFNWSLLSHVAKDHYITLKPAHLSYKCTVCTATFSQYKQFENHVYSSHSTIARLAVDKSKSTPAVQKQINVTNQPSTSMSKGK